MTLCMLMSNGLGTVRRRLCSFPVLFSVMLVTSLPRRYSGVLMGLSNTAGTLPGIVMPSFTNAVAYSTDHATLEKQWQLVFNVSAIVNVIGTVRACELRALG